MLHLHKGFGSFCKAMPIWLRKNYFKKNVDRSTKNMTQFQNSEKIFFSDHHLSHATSAFFPSPFEEAIVLTADGVEIGQQQL